VSRGRLAAVPETARRDGAYVRVSALMGRSGEDFISPSIQIDTITAASARTGGRIAAGHVWEDIDVSGRSMDREAIALALQAARDGLIDRLWVYDLSRWARNAADGLAELAAIEKTGVEVLSATEGVDRSTTAGRLTAGLLLLLAEHYSDLVSDRWKSVHLHNAERGVHHGTPPFGYVRTGKREITPDPTIGPLVGDMFRRHADGESIAALARSMSRSLGRRFDPAQVSSILRNLTYVGVVRLNGQVYPGRHEALVDEDTFAAVQKNLAANAKVPSRSKDARHSLAGLVFCGRCKGSMHKRNRDRARQTANDPFYFCRSAYLDRGLCAGVGTPRCADVERLVLEDLARRIEGHADQSAAQAAAEAARRARVRSDRRTLDDEIAGTKKAIAAAAVKNARGVLSDVAYGLAVESLEATLAGLQGRLQEVQEEEYAPSFSEAASLAAALLELWRDMTDSEKSDAIRTHVRRVEVQPLPPGKRGPRQVVVTTVALG
jgi:site-specific DNA recombinase